MRPLSQQIVRTFTPSLHRDAMNIETKSKTFVDSVYHTFPIPHTRHRSVSWNITVVIPIPNQTVIIFLPTGLPYYPSQAFVHDNPKIVSPHFLRSPGERTLLHPLLR